MTIFWYWPGRNMPSCGCYLVNKWVKNYYMLVIVCYLCMILWVVSAGFWLALCCPQRGSVGGDGRGHEGGRGDPGCVLTQEGKVREPQLHLNSSNNIYTYDIFIWFIWFIYKANLTWWGKIRFEDETTLCLSQKGNSCQSGAANTEDK